MTRGMLQRELLVVLIVWFLTLQGLKKLDKAVVADALRQGASPDTVDLSGREADQHLAMQQSGRSRFLSYSGRKC
jgi:hypothetical protein